MIASEQRLEALAQALPTFGLFLVALATFAVGCWIVCRWTARPWLRIAAGPPLAALAFWTSVLAPLRTETGTWQCYDCGEAREELRAVGIRLGASRRIEPTCLEAPVPKKPGGEHRWVVVGCHVTRWHGGDAVGCAFGPPVEPSR